MKNYLFLTIIIILLSDTHTRAESVYRFRYFQAAMIANKVEYESYDDGSKEYPMEALPSLNNGIIVFRDRIGFGYSKFKTKINAIDYERINYLDNGLAYEAEADFYDFGYLVTGKSESSFTLGFGLANQGKGKISSYYNNSHLESSDVQGFSVFVQGGLKYTLPVDVTVFSVKYIEILLGYKKVYLEYSGYKNEQTRIKSKQHISSSQLQYGVGIVF